MKNAFWVLVILFPLCANADVVIDKPAPMFSLKGTDGKTYSLDSFKEDIVVLEWINHDCPFVKKHYNSKYRNMQSLQEEFTKKGVKWFSIGSSAKGKQGNYTVKEWNGLSKSKGSKATSVLLDENGELGKLYGAKVTPHMFILNKGILVYAGGIDNKPSTNPRDIPSAKNFVKTALNELLAGGSVTTKSSTPYGCSVKY
ncbi:MAG: thioredoxin family protein [Bdellovibrionales bacterium]|nr:thioredoxin family protein [Bdellovibrionales bacterium]